MKSPDFDYVRPDSLAEVFEMLKNHDGRAQLLAGGQSLMAIMNLRMADPELLIDINGLPGMRSIEKQGDRIRIGALVTHRELLESPVVAECVPLLSQAVPYVAHVAIRNKGTIGGSLALADPAAEYPAVAQALGATIIAASPAGERRIQAADYFLGFYQTALQPEEVLLAVEFPVAAPGQHFVFCELARRHGDFAMVGLAAAITLSGASVQAASFAFCAVAGYPQLASTAMAGMVGKKLDSAQILAAQEALETDLTPNGDLQANAATKVHLARVLLGRALEQMRVQP